MSLLINDYAFLFKCLKLLLIFMSMIMEAYRYDKMFDLIIEAVTVAIGLCVWNPISAKSHLP